MLKFLFFIFCLLLLKEYYFFGVINLIFFCIEFMFSKVEFGFDFFECF